MKNETRQILKNIIDRSRKLKKHGLEKHIKDTGFRFYVQPNGNVKFNEIDEKESDASILSLRLFTQGRDKFSFSQLEDIAKDTGLSNDFREFLHQVRDEFFEFINGYPQSIKPGFFEAGKHLSRKDIYDVVMYGSLRGAHHVSQEERYKLWTKDPIKEGVLLNVAFPPILIGLLLLIYKLAEKCEEELKSNPNGDLTTL